VIRTVVADAVALVGLCAGAAACEQGTIDLLPVAPADAACAQAPAPKPPPPAPTPPPPAPPAPMMMTTMMPAPPPAPSPRPGPSCADAAPCPPMTPLCDPASEHCVECLSTADCGAMKSCDSATNRCVPANGCAAAADASAE